jgi:hypothetical protein
VQHLDALAERAPQPVQRRDLFRCHDLGGAAALRDALGRVGAEHGHTAQGGRIERQGGLMVPEQHHPRGGRLP